MTKGHLLIMVNDLSVLNDFVLKLPILGTKYIGNIQISQFGKIDPMRDVIRLCGFQNIAELYNG